MGNAVADQNPSWHALFAPLPDGVMPERKPVAPPEIMARPEGAAIKGWEQLFIHLSAGPTGSRTVLVVLDGEGRPISASDAVLYRRIRPEEPASEAIEYLCESVGGRIESDGTFLGTRWRSISVGPEDSDDAQQNESTPSVPSETDIVSLKSLVMEMLRRAQSQV